MPLFFHFSNDLLVFLCFVYMFWVSVGQSEQFKRLCALLTCNGHLSLNDIYGINKQ